MGIAKDKLTASERESIARSILQGSEPNLKNGGELWAHCPFHQEETPGGSFKYNVEMDVTHCFGCGANEDLVGLYCHNKGLAPDDSDGFRAFVKEYCDGNFTPKDARSISPAPLRQWEPKTPEEVPALWREKAMAFANDCNEVLLFNQEQLDRLLAWGITAETVTQLGIGWNEKAQYRNYSGWGLPKIANPNTGKERKIMLPAGFVFPVMDFDYQLYRMQIRADETSNYVKRYNEIRGGCTRPCIFGERDTRIWVVVETIRDAMFAWQELHQLGVGAMALGGATHRPDDTANKLLACADLIMNALDNDQAGRTNSWHFEPWNTGKFAWMNQYPHAIRWVVPSRVGKDLGDLPKAGIRLRDWFWAGLPEYIRQRYRAQKTALTISEEQQQEATA